MEEIDKNDTNKVSKFSSSAYQQEIFSAKERYSEEIKNLCSPLNSYIMDMLEAKKQNDVNHVEENRRNRERVYSLSEIGDKRSVSFDQVDIREYYIELGDNPSCSRGPPLTIGWDFDCMGSIDLDEFEECRPPRRLARQMAIPFDQRENILEQVGYSDSEIMDAVKSVDLERHQRLKTAKSRSIKLDELRDRANRTFKRVFHKK